MNDVVLEKLCNGRVISLDEASVLSKSFNSSLPFGYAYSFNDKIEDGGDGAVFEAKGGGSVAIKIYYEDDLEYIRNSFVKQEKLRFKFGELIAKPEGMFNVYCIDREVFYEGFAMERLPGKDVRKCIKEGSVSEEALAEMKKAWGMMIEAGFRSFYGDEIQWKNIIYDSISGRFGFVDFDRDYVPFGDSEKG